MKASRALRPPMSEETREKIRKNSLNMSVETKAKISAKASLFTHSNESKLKISKANLGKNAQTSNEPK